MADGGGHHVVWVPLPGSQELALSCPANHILFDGTRGPGKTEAQLMKFRRYVGIGYGRFWRGVIFDHEYKNLDDLVSKSKHLFKKFGDGARFLNGQGQYKWVWPTGEELLLRAAKDEADYWDHHGHEFPFIGFNELTKYSSPDFYDMILSCNRSSFRPQDYPQKDENGNEYLLPSIPLIVFNTTNPYGPGRNWVKRRFIDVAPPGVIVKIKTKVYNPQTQLEEEIITTQVRIFGSYKENKYLDPKYIATLKRMKNKNRRKAWLAGDWNVASGGAVDDLWDPIVHIVPRFKIPKGWYCDRAMDWGSSKPFSIGWWAEANGEEVEITVGGKTVKWAPPRGSLIRFHEWYGTEELGTNTGLRKGSVEVAREIKRIEAALVKMGWCASRPNAGPADNSIGAVIDGSTNSTATLMVAEGIEWTKSNKSPGSRRDGLTLFRERLENASTKEGPGIFVMQHCAAFIELIPQLPLDPMDPDDVDTDAEDHAWDETRYRILNSRGEVKRSNLRF